MQSRGYFDSLSIPYDNFARYFIVLHSILTDTFSKFEFDGLKYIKQDTRFCLHILTYLIGSRA